MLEYCVYAPAQSLELRLMTAETTSGRFMVKQNWAAHLNWRHNIVLLQNKENLLELTAPHKLNWVEFPFHLFICFVKYSAYLFILDYEFFFFYKLHTPIFLKPSTYFSSLDPWFEIEDTGKCFLTLSHARRIIYWREFVVLEIIKRVIFVLLDKVWWSAARRRRWMDEVLLTDY